MFLLAGLGYALFKTGKVSQEGSKAIGNILIYLVLPASLQPMKLALLLAISCPVGSNVAVYAQLHGKDYPYAVGTVILSTLFSLVTIPAMIWLTSVIW